MVIDYLFEKSAPGGFDLIVMDIMMPEMNGYGAARGYQYAAKGVGKCIMSFDIIMIKTAEKRIKKVLTQTVYFVILCLALRQIKRNAVCGSVGTGRRARLRILWQQCRVGSSPIFRMI